MSKKYENYLLVLACAYRANKKRVKNGKKGQKKAKNSLGHPLARAKKEFIALIIKIEINKILFRSLCY